MNVIFGIPEGEFIEKLTKWDGKLTDFLKEYEELVPEVDTLYIHEIIPCERINCGQGCKPNKKGCREHYILDNWSLFIIYSYIKK